MKKHQLFLVISIFFNPLNFCEAQIKGTLWMWGDGWFGDGKDSRVSEFPEMIDSDTQWISIGAGEGFSLGVKANGSLFGWGDNRYGQLGDFSKNYYRSFYQRDNLSYKSVKCATYNAFIFRADNTLWGWGENGAGQLNLSNTLETDFIDVSIGRSHALAIKNDGTLWACGYNDKGQLGTEKVFFTTSPVQITPETNYKWIKIAAGGSHSLGIQEDGSLWAWGDNDYGYLGRGPRDTILYEKTPKRVGNDNDWIFVEAGYWVSYGIKRNGTLWAWGRNDRGQLGVGVAENIQRVFSYPQQIGKDTNWAFIDVSNSSSFACGIKKDGSLWIWGIRNNVNSPKQLGKEKNWISVVCDEYHCLGIRNNQIQKQLSKSKFEDQTLKKCNIYPNPTSDKLFIEFDQNSKFGYELEILDVVGKSVYKGKLKSHKETIDVSKWNSKGIYLIRILDKNNAQIDNRKIVIE